MKQDLPKHSLKDLCRLFGRTRHAYYAHGWRIEHMELKDDIVLQSVLKIRASLPRLGTLKLHAMLVPILEFHQIRIGRDYLFDLMRTHNLDIRRRKRMAVTTDSRHWMHKYANLIKELKVSRPEQLWVSDITYIRMSASGQFGYLSLITDAYSRKIMGFAFRNDLSAKGCIDALNMAYGQRQYDNKLIHHSDRGSQYCCKSYVELLLDHGVAISMTENGDPYENALAERVNGILKAEFDLYSSPLGFKETCQQIDQSIRSYNQLRPHSSCDFLTPEQAHLRTGELKKRWKNRINKAQQKILV
jgi:putative transposase